MPLGKAKSTPTKAKASYSMPMKEYSKGQKMSKKVQPKKRKAMASEY